MSTPDRKRTTVSPEHVLAVRTGHGANCSSIGSVIDTLFVTALAGGAIFAAAMAALSSEPVTTLKGGGGAARGPDRDEATRGGREGDDRARRSPAGDGAGEEGS
jgi:hypothetical protein